MFHHESKKGVLVPPFSRIWHNWSYREDRSIWLVTICVFAVIGEALHFHFTMRLCRYSFLGRRRRRVAQYKWMSVSASYVLAVVTWCKDISVWRQSRIACRRFDAICSEPAGCTYGIERTCFRSWWIDLMIGCAPLALRLIYARQAISRRSNHLSYWLLMV